MARKIMDNLLNHVKTADALPYLKITPEAALLILENCIVTGYKLKDKINAEYNSVKSEPCRSKRDQVASLAPLWRQHAKKWANETIEDLSTVFVSQKELYNFRDAPPSPFVRVNASPDWNCLINQLEAQIAKLNEYDKNIHDRFSVKVEVVGRDKIVQENGNITIQN